MPSEEERLDVDYMRKVLSGDERIEVDGELAEHGEVLCFRAKSLQSDDTFLVSMRRMDDV